MRAALQVITAAALSLVFFYAGVMKLSDPLAFYHSITLYRIIPDEAGSYLALYLPWLEIAIGAALLRPKTRLAGSLLASSLIVVFIGAMGLAWSRGLVIECGCFGATHHPSSYFWTIIRDVFLLGASLYLARSCIRSPYFPR